VFYLIKRSKSEDINIIRSQFEMYSNEKNEILHVAPFYINEKGNKYSVIAEGISGSSERIKESPKYVFLLSLLIIMCMILLFLKRRNIYRERILLLI